MKTCMADNCKTPIHSTRNKSGLCSKHCRKLRKKNETRKCIVEGCNDPVSRRKMCEKHYTRVYRGQPLLDTICVIDNCEQALRNDNKSGYCKYHKHLSPGSQKSLKKYRDNNKEKQSIRNKEYALKNPEKRREIDRKRLKRDPGRNARWRQANPEKARIIQQRRRAKENEAFVEDIDSFSVWCRDSGLCFLCGYPAEKTNWWLEHVVPISRGGTHEYANVAVSHPYCNRKKWNKYIEEWTSE